MKKVKILMAVMAVAVLSVCPIACVSINYGGSDNVSFSGKSPTLRPDDNIVSREISIGDFDEIETKFINVVYSVGRPGKATLSAPSNVIDLVKVKNDGGKLKLNLKEPRNIEGHLNATLVVSSTGVDEIGAYLGAVVKVTTPLNVSGDLELDATTSSTIIMKEVRCSKAEIDVTTSTSISIDDMKCDGKLDLQATTNSSINIKRAAAKKLDAQATTSASINVAAGNVGIVDLDATTGANLVVMAAITGGEAEATTGATIRTDISKLSERTATTGGSVNGL